MKVPNNDQDISVIIKALKISSQKHCDQRRNDEQSSPYINHLIDVLECLWEIGKIRDIDTLVAGILHDTIEDTETTPLELKDLFGENICGIVEEVTDDKSLPKQVRKELQIKHAGSLSKSARHVKLADKICNVREIMDNPPMDWDQARRLEYITWAKKVIKKIQGTNKNFENYFYDLCDTARKKIKQESGA